MLTSGVIGFLRIFGSIRYSSQVVVALATDKIDGATEMSTLVVAATPVATPAEEQS
jgi:hypothetical protein